MTVCKGAYSMTEDERKYFSRSENKRSQRHQSNKMDRILNYLIAIVIVLIGISSYLIFFTGDKEEVHKDQSQEENGQISNNGDSNESDNSNVSDNGNEQGDKQDGESGVEGNDHNSSTSAIVSPSTDPLVSEVIVDPNWQPTATAQTGPHTSVFAEGHIDYDEKLATIYAVTSLSEDNSILWKIKNNGSADTAIAVISSKDKEQKYRVSIEWVANEGWKPVKLEILNTLEGAY